MTDEEYLKKAEKDLELLQQEYANYGKEIEKLMQLNRDTAKINDLIKRKDEVDQRISLVNRKIKVMKEKLIADEHKEHQKIIYQIEELLKIKITPIKGFEVTSDKKIAKEVFKDYKTLVNEYKTILEQLASEQDKGLIDYATYRKMHKELQKEYEKMYQRAPKIADKEKVDNLFNSEPSQFSENEFEKSFREKFDLPENQKDVKEELEISKRELRREKFYKKIKDLGLNISDMDLEKLFMEQEIINQNTEQVEQTHRNLM